MKTKFAFEQQIYLRDVDLFQDLTDEEIKALGERMPMREVAAGTIFYRPDEPTEVLFLIRSGRVRLYHLSAEGKDFTTAVLEPGTFFGEMTLLGQRLYGSYAEAVTPCVLCLMSRDDVRTLLLSDRRIAYRAVEMLGQRLIESERRLADLALKRVPARLAAALLLLAHNELEHKQDAPLVEPIEVVCTHEELSHMVGTHRETITRVLNELQGQGLIELHRGRIVLLDPEGLRQLRDD